MKRFKWLAVLALAAMALFWRPKADSPAGYPDGWFFRQRAYPYQDINYPVYRQAMVQKKALLSNGPNPSQTWEFAGPTNIGGRITDLELVPGEFADAEVLYAGAASGGVFRSFDSGQNWEPIFDQTLSLSIGDIEIDRNDPQTIYVGTGEPNAGGGSLTYNGFGVYKSLDGGNTWTNIGLEETRLIGRIAVDSKNSQRVFVAAMGNLFSTNSERGLFRSLDAGASWERVLFETDSTGCIDVLLHPSRTDTVYAALWERIRMPYGRDYGGLSSGIYRSYDGGESWTELTDGLPSGDAIAGRIGLAIAPTNPNVLYAIYADRTGFFDGVYKTTDGGDSWERTNDDALSSFYSSFGWWFGKIFVDPTDENTAFALGLPMVKTVDGGASWQRTFIGVHVDQHAVAFSPQPGRMFIGNDGGVYHSANAGTTWTKSPDLPITQFYTCEIDEQLPERLYGGTQDNGTNRTRTGSLDDWRMIWGGDGFYVLVDPNDNNFVYAESQRGGLVRSINGGETFGFARAGIDSDDRNNWSAPLAFNPQNTASLFFGTSRLYKSTNRAQSWTAISPDLSDGPGTNLIFGTLTTIAVAPADSQVIYIGYDDGNVWVTQNGGTDWEKISTDLPRRWVTRLGVDPSDPAVAYVTLSGFRRDMFQPHILRTDDFGSTWQDISANLPEVPLNDVIIDPDIAGRLFVASDVGVFTSFNDGNSWDLLGNGLPNVPVTDLDYHQPTRTLVAATYGRSMYRLELQDATSIAAREPVPKTVTLLQNYPNPFNPETRIRFELERNESVRLEVYDIGGRLVRTLTEGDYSAGRHEVTWSGRDRRGVPVASGTYLYRLFTSERIEARKMTLVR